MPHEPGHRRTNGRRTSLTQTGGIYTVAGTGEQYRGKVVEIGGQLYTTVDGALEGNSVRLNESPTSANVVTPPAQPVDMVVPGRGRRGSIVTPSPSDSIVLPASTNRRSGATTQRSMGNSEPILFNRGDGSRYDRTYYLPSDYVGPLGTAGGPVNSGTPLHRHTDSNRTMTQHNMSGTGLDASVVVTTNPPGSRGRMRRGTTPSTSRRQTSRSRTSGTGQNRAGGTMNRNRRSGY